MLDEVEVRVKDGTGVKEVVIDGKVDHMYEHQNNTLRKTLLKLFFCKTWVKSRILQKSV